VLLVRDVAGHPDRDSVTVSCTNASTPNYAASDRLETQAGYSGDVSTSTGWMRPVRRSVQVGERFRGQGISPAARRSAMAASSEMAYRSPAAAAWGTMSGWNRVAIGAAKSDRFELTSTRE
jgi:hypothetical protein